MSKESKINVWFPTYIGDFFSVTATMSGHEVGAFQLIIAKLWKDGGAIPADDRSLAKLCKATPRQFRDIKETLWPLFEIKAGMLSHPSVTEQIEKARQLSANRRVAGIASGRSRKAASDEQVFNKCSTIAELRAFEGEGEGPSGKRTLIGREGDATRENDPNPFEVIAGGRP